MASEKSSAQQPMLDIVEKILHKKQMKKSSYKKNHIIPIFCAGESHLNVSIYAPLSLFFAANAMCSMDITEPDGTKIHLLSPYKQHNVQSYYYEIVWTSDFDNTASIVFNITLAEVMKLRFLEKICTYCNCIKRF